MTTPNSETPALDMGMKAFRQLLEVVAVHGGVIALAEPEAARSMYLDLVEATIERMMGGDEIILPPIVLANLDHKWVRENLL